MRRIKLKVERMKGEAEEGAIGIGLNRSWNNPPGERGMAATRVSRMAQCGQHGAGSASGAELMGKVHDELLRRILEPNVMGLMCIIKFRKL